MHDSDEKFEQRQSLFRERREEKKNLIKSIEEYMDKKREKGEIWSFTKFFGLFLQEIFIFDLLFFQLISLGPFSGMIRKDMVDYSLLKLNKAIILKEMLLVFRTLKI